MPGALTPGYAQQRIEVISLGLIPMRRSSSGVTWFRADEAPDKMLGPCDEAILQGFVQRDFLQTVPDDQALLEARLRVAAEARWPIPALLTRLGCGW